VGVIDADEAPAPREPRPCTAGEAASRTHRAKHFNDPRPFELRPASCVSRVIAPLIAQPRAHRGSSVDRAWPPAVGRGLLNVPHAEPCLGARAEVLVAVAERAQLQLVCAHEELHVV
jgi:hypothetical protein